MKTKIRDWLLSIDDRKIMKFGYCISDLLIFGLGMFVGYLIK